MSELFFDQFYNIQFGEPEGEELPSFSFTKIDNFGRISDRVYGTIEPRDPESVTIYDADALCELLSEYLRDKFNVYKISDVAVIMKTIPFFREVSLIDFFEGNIGMLCIRAGLGVNLENNVCTVYDKMPTPKITEWDCAIINELQACRAMTERGDGKKAIEHFKARFPSVMFGYEGPDVLKPPTSFMDDAAAMIDEVLDNFGVEPYTVVRTPVAVYYEVYGGIDLSASSHRITVCGSDEKRVWRQSVVRGKEIVSGILRSHKQPDAVTVCTKDFKRIMDKLDTSVHDIISDGNDVLHFTLDQRIIVHNHGHSFVAEFTIGERSYKVTLVYRIDVDSFIAHLESVLNGAEEFKWFPHFA